MTQPKQKPGRSIQNYATPAVFLEPVKRRLGIEAFTHDFAADPFNSKASSYWTKQDDSLAQSSERWATRCHGGWGWLNPPFAKIGPWARKCWETKQLGGSIALLVPAGVGSNWFRDFVHGKAFVLALNGRIPFDPANPTWGYPKDCILALYGAPYVVGFDVWTWGLQTKRNAA